MTQLNLREIEKEVKDYWKEHDIYNIVIEAHKGGKEVLFLPIIINTSERYKPRNQSFAFTM